MRLFVALDIDPSIQQRLDDYIRILQPRFSGVRFVRSSNYHVTLKFLGELPTADAVRKRLHTIHESSFEIKAGGVGFFPDARSPRVFWAGINAPALPGLACKVSQALEPLGFPLEREFRPHLTLARNGSGRPRPLRGERPIEAFAQLSAFVANAPVPEYGTMTARQFFLYESKLSPSGPSYSKLETFELAG